VTFRGRVALVTGAASGMGQLSAWRLAAGGAQVVAVDVDAQGLARTARHAPMVHPMVVDVADAAAVAALVAEVEADLGPIGRVVNAAAVASPLPLLDEPVDHIARVTAVNYLGVVNVTLSAMPAMVGRGTGDVVQFASLAGWIPTPFLGAYAATKAAVVSFTETLFHEQRSSGVRICCACPSFVDTPMVRDAEGVPGGADRLPLIPPEAVLDGIEAALEAGSLYTFAGRGSAAAWRLRRLAPRSVGRAVAAMARPPS
jgi:NAD(P)-dependent dehydrogenase (short-subunit alcohol dehydrogenase family)